MERVESMNGAKKSVFKTLVKDNLMNKEFALGVVLPILFFTVLDAMGKTLLGTVVAGVWSIAVVVIQYLKTRNANVFAIMSAIFSVIGVVGTLISRDPRFYMASPIAIDVLLAVVFLGSLFMKKPLLQLLAEQSVKGKFPETLTCQPKFKRAWVILSVAWGILSLSQAGLRVLLIQTTPLHVYYAISSVYGTLTTPAMLLFSFWFPGWYWKR